MSNQEFEKLVSRCDFLMDWQKDRMMGMLDDGELDEDDGGNGRVVHREAAFQVIDNVLWRTMGVGLDSLPPMDRIGIEQAVMEVTY